MHALQATTDDGAENAPGVDARVLTQAGSAVDAVQATLAHWRQQGAHRADPVRFAVLEAMARRAAGHADAAQQVLAARLDALVEQYQAVLAAQNLSPAVGGTVALPDATAATGEGVPPRTAVPVVRSALGVLVDALVRGTVPPSVPAGSAAAPAPRPRTPASASGGRKPASVQSANAAIPTLPPVDLATATLHSTAAPAAPQELQSVRRFRGTWSRLSADERLRQTLAQVPPQAGPLNALHLLHRALVQMRDISPDYLQHFVEHVDALLWLEQVQAAATPAAGARTSARPNARAIAKKQAAARKR